MSGVYKRKKYEDAEPATLLDRFAISLFSGLTALLTGLIFLGILLGSGIVSIDFGFLPIKIIALFAVIMALFGFLLLENIILNIFATLWRWLYSFLGFVWYR
jgi:hypothetical protein